MDQVFDEIAKVRANDFNETGFKPKRNSSGKPLILAPPVIKSFEEKPPSSRKKFTIEQSEEESSDLLEIVGGSEDYLKEEMQEEYEESSSEIIVDESSNLSEEDPDQLLALDESPEEPFFYEDHDESAEYQYESAEYQYESDDHQYESAESPSEPMGLAKAAYSGKKSKTEMTKVRLPLHLADVELEIDIFDTFTLAKPISAVSNVECSLHSIDAEVLLPSASLFTKGTLLLNIDYACTDKSGTMHSLMIHIPWKKIIPVKWIHQPELSSKNSKEYLFTSTFGMEEGYTREYRESLVEKVEFSLSGLHCIWNEQFILNDRVMIQGTARMQIDLYQKQCLDLQKLISL
ncbi:hypothetical protein LC048_08390 [Mesobacillus subterraneus]|uniref:hypothetical protein n=1 Tax=Mesobacillus subterraneus TaxID=285983 RepID=UPI001CFCE63A|nr:hypothetical protein [Mesobacillus subterraneus]WLR56872.1 hypothetical protein LC048_08390 [Mesobacillus subterraneus]